MHLLYLCHCDEKLIRIEFLDIYHLLSDNSPVSTYFLIVQRNSHLYNMASDHIKIPHHNLELIFLTCCSLFI